MTLDSAQLKAFGQFLLDLAKGCFLAAIAAPTVLSFVTLIIQVTLTVLGCVFSIYGLSCLKGQESYDTQSK